MMVVISSCMFVASALRMSSAVNTFVTYGTSLRSLGVRVAVTTTSLMVSVLSPICFSLVCGIIVPVSAADADVTAMSIAETSRWILIILV